MNNILKIKLSEEIPQKAKDSTLDEKKKLCERLGLKAQAKMCKASALGTRVIRREDISGILNTSKFLSFWGRYHLEYC